MASVPGYAPRDASASAYGVGSNLCLVVGIINMQPKETLAAISIDFGREKIEIRNMPTIVDKKTVMPSLYKTFNFDMLQECHPYSEKLKLRLRESDLSEPNEVLWIQPMGASEFNLLEKILNTVLLEKNEDVTPSVRALELCEMERSRVCFKRTSLRIGKSLLFLKLVERKLLIFSDLQERPAGCIPLSAAQIKHDKMGIHIENGKSSNEEWFSFDPEEKDIWLEALETSKTVSQDNVRLAERTISSACALSRTSFNVENKQHTNMLEQLWEAVIKEGLNIQENYSFNSESWKFLGFSSTEPHTELSNTTVLVLANLLYLAQVYHPFLMQLIHEQTLGIQQVAVNGNREAPRSLLTNSASMGDLNATTAVNKERTYLVVRVATHITEGLIKILKMSNIGRTEAFPIFTAGSDVFERLFCNAMALFHKRYQGASGTAVIDSVLQTVRESLRLPSVHETPAVIDSLQGLLADQYTDSLLLQKLRSSSRFNDGVNIPFRLSLDQALREMANGGEVSESVHAEEVQPAHSLATKKERQSKRKSISMTRNFMRKRKVVTDEVSRRQSVTVNRNDFTISASHVHTAALTTENVSHKSLRRSRSYSADHSITGRRNLSGDNTIDGGESGVIFALSNSIDEDADHVSTVLISCSSLPAQAESAINHEKVSDGGGDDSSIHNYSLPDSYSSLGDSKSTGEASFGSSNETSGHAAFSKAPSSGNISVTQSSSSIKKVSATRRAIDRISRLLSPREGEVLQEKLAQMASESTNTANANQDQKEEEPGHNRKDSVSCLKSGSKASMKQERKKRRETLSSSRAASQPVRKISHSGTEDGPVETFEEMIARERMEQEILMEKSKLAGSAAMFTQVQLEVEAAMERLNRSYEDEQSSSKEGAEYFSLPTVKTNLSSGKLEPLSSDSLEASPCINPEAGANTGETETVQPTTRTVAISDPPQVQANAEAKAEAKAKAEANAEAKAEAEAEANAEANAEPSALGPKTADVPLVIESTSSVANQTNPKTKRRKSKEKSPRRKVSSPREVAPSSKSPRSTSPRSSSSKKKPKTNDKRKLTRSKSQEPPAPSSSTSLNTVDGVKVPHRHAKHHKRKSSKRLSKPEAEPVQIIKPLNENEILSDRNNLDNEFQRKESVSTAKKSRREEVPDINLHENFSSKPMKKHSRSKTTPRSLRSHDGIEERELSDKREAIVGELVLKRWKNLNCLEWENESDVQKLFSSIQEYIQSAKNGGTKLELRLVQISPLNQDERE